jgi:hypothetical protein
MERLDKVRAEVADVLLKESQANNQALKDYILNVNGALMIDRVKWVLTLLDKSGFFHFNRHLDGERRIRQSGFGRVAKGTLPIFSKMLGTSIEVVSRGLLQLRAEA